MGRKIAIPANALQTAGGVCFFLATMVPLFERTRDHKKIPSLINIMVMASAFLYVTSSLFSVANLCVKPASNENIDDKEMHALERACCNTQTFSVLSAGAFFIGSTLLIIEGLYRLVKSFEHDEAKINSVACLLFLLGSGLTLYNAVKTKIDPSYTITQAHRVFNVINPLISGAGSALFLTDAILRNENTELVTWFERITGGAYLVANCMICFAYMCQYSESKKEEERTLLGL